MVKFKYVEITITNQNSIHAQIKSRSVTECRVHATVHATIRSRTLSSHLLYRTIILPDVLYGCETCSHTLQEKYRLWVSKNRADRKISRPKTGEVTGAILRTFKSTENWRKTANKYAVLLPHLPNNLPSALHISNKMNLQLTNHKIAPLHVWCALCIMKEYMACFPTQCTSSNWQQALNPR